MSNDDNRKEAGENGESVFRVTGEPVMFSLCALFFIHCAFLLSGGWTWSAREIEARVQEGMSTPLRVPANALRVAVGFDASGVRERDGELFYLPDLEHLAGKSFLEGGGKNSHVVLRRGEQERRMSDPLPAITDFAAQLRKRGIELVVMPTPSKAAFAAPGGKPIRNAGHAEFVARLQQAGVRVFDPAEALAGYAGKGRDLFLKADSHWRPETMQVVTLLLGAYLQKEDLIEDDGRVEVQAMAKRITGAGDLATLREGPSGGTKGVETVTTFAKVFPESGGAVPVVVLGDSFTNIFSDAELGWGEAAGFGETLGQVLGRRVAIVARNGDGALASRRALAEEIGVLDEARVVIWQFAERELSFGDWRLVGLPEKERAGGKGEGTSGVLEVTGTVVSVGKVPAGRTPYRKAVVEVHLKEVQGAELPAEIVLLGIGVEEWEATAMARWRAGEEVQVTARPWSAAAVRFGRLRRIALDDPDFELIDLPRFWVE